MACDRPSDFVLDIGEIVLSGPTRGQDTKCLRGRNCLKTFVQGYNLMDGDSLLVLYECGLPATPGRTAFEGGLATLTQGGPLEGGVMGFRRAIGTPTARTQQNPVIERGAHFDFGLVGEDVEPGLYDQPAPPVTNGRDSQFETEGNGLTRAVSAANSCIYTL